MSSTEKVLRAKIQAVDNFTKPMQKVISQTKAFQATAKAVKPLVLKAKDMASKVISKVKAQVDKFKATKFGQFVLKAKDMASKVLSKVNGTLRAFAGKVWSATVSVKDKASSVLSSIQSKLSALALGATIGVAVKGGIDGLGEEQMQKITISNAVENTGKSKEEAKKITDSYYKELESFANATPFTNSEVAGFGVKAMQMAKGNAEKAMEYTKAQGSVKALVGDMRTAQEVSEAFFSASNGNMDSINNILGENYQNFDELIQGVNTKQKDVLNDMSQTIPGLLSTVKGKASNAMKKFVEVFKTPLTNIFSTMGNMIENITPKLVEFGERIFSSFEAFSKSEQASQYMQIFKTVFEVTWNIVKATIDAVRPVIEAIFSFIAQHSTEISTIIQTFGTIWQSVWKTVGVLLQGAWSICEPILSTLLKALSKVSGAVEEICSWWNKMTELLKTPINAVVNVAKKGASWVGDKLGLSEGKKSAWGTKRVVGNDVPYRLHDGERVLSRVEADRYDKGQNTQGVNIIVNGLTVREEADINKIANKLVRKINQSKMVYAGGAY
jgi:phage-related protein